MSYLNTLFFGIYPYIALLVCIVASIIRYDREQYTWKAGSSQLLRKEGMRAASNMFHVGVIFILMGHIVGLLTPSSIYHHLISSEAKQMLAMVSGGFFGIVCLMGMTMLLKRRFTDARIRASTSRADMVILLMLYIQLILGLATIPASAQHLDGSEMISLANWAQSIATFQSAQAVQSIAGVGLIFKLHVFFGLTIVLLFPFSRLVHIASVPTKYFARNYQIVRQKNFG